MTLCECKRTSWSFVCVFVCGRGRNLTIPRDRLRRAARPYRQLLLLLLLLLQGLGDAEPQCMMCRAATRPTTNDRWKYTSTMAAAPRKETRFWSASWDDNALTLPGLSPPRQTSSSYHDDDGGGG
jgi:hypothetical protein